MGNPVTVFVLNNVNVLFLKYESYDDNKNTTLSYD